MKANPKLKFVIYILKNVKKKSLNFYFKYKKSFSFFKHESEENKYMERKPFKFVICVENCTGCISKIYSISRYDCRMGKIKALNYSQLNLLLFSIFKKIDVLTNFEVNYPLKSIKLFPIPFYKSI